MELSRLRTRNINIIWAALFIALNVVDCVTTMRFMGSFMGGLAGNGECSPVMAFMEPMGLLAYKVGLPILVILGLYKWNRLRLLKPLNIAMGIIVVWNILWLIFA